jgi:hypothetical protein
MDEIIVLCINANQMRLVQYPLIQHNYLYDCQNFKPECRASSLNALRERKVRKPKELLHFFGNNTYPYEEIAISCSKAVLRNMQWIMNFGMWIFCWKDCVIYSGVRLYLTHCSRKRRRNNIYYKDYSLLECETV